MLVSLGYGVEPRLLKCINDRCTRLLSRLCLCGATSHEVNSTEISGCQAAAEGAAIRKYLYRLGIETSVQQRSPKIGGCVAVSQFNCPSVNSLALIAAASL